MDELDILLLAENDPDEAINQARLVGNERLAAKLNREARERSIHVFEHIRAAKISIRDAAFASGVPQSSAQSAAQGYSDLNMTRGERARLLNYVLDRINALQRAKRLLQER